MTLFVRHALRLVGDVLWNAVRSGTWWLPVAIAAFTIAAIIAVSAQTAVPTAVYVLF